jgi:hypothetical protein
MEIGAHMSAELQKVIREMAEDLERAKRVARIWDEVFDAIYDLGGKRLPDRRDGLKEIHPLGEGLDE